MKNCGSHGKEKSCEIEGGSQEVTGRVDAKNFHKQDNLGWGNTNSPELSLLNFFAINLPSQPFLGQHFGFYNFFHRLHLRGATYS